LGIGDLGFWGYNKKIIGYWGLGNGDLLGEIPGR